MVEFHSADWFPSNLPCPRFLNKKQEFAANLTSASNILETHYRMRHEISVLMPCTTQLLLSAIILSILFPFLGLAQEEGGTAGGKHHAAVLDQLRRPITAGGFEDSAPAFFADITRATGLEKFEHRAGFPEKRYIIDTKSGGVALFDYNNDGWLDIYILSGSPFGALFGREPHGISRLFKNNSDGTFTDVTTAAGVPNSQWAFGVVAGDYDGDGLVDLYVSNFGPNRLYKNNGDGTFSNVAPTAGVEIADVLTTGAAFGDFNRDGLLDLFVCGYAKFDPNHPPRPGVDLPLSYCQFRGDDVMCGPRGLTGSRDFLFKNNGDGTFTEIGSTAGVEDGAGYYGFSPVWIDVNDDSWIDLVVANDSTPNYLYINNGDGTFEDVSYVAGFALNQDGRAQAGMGIAVGDYNLDGLVDFYVAHFSDDYNTLYQNQGDVFFLDVSYETGLGESTIPFVSWGTAFLDYDNDGFEDLFLANGHVYPSVDNHEWGTSWAQRPLLFRNREGRRFELMPAATGTGLAVVVTARGAAFGDLDNDGRIDVVMNCVDSPPKVLRNVTDTDGNWLKVKLVGGKNTPPWGTGAALFLTSGGKTQRKDVFTGGSFISSSDPRLHFGLGDASAVDSLKVRWPSGGIQELKHLPVNKLIEIREGENDWVVIPMKNGWNKPSS